MSRKGRPLTSKPKVRKHCPMSIHEDNLPEIAPIPFKLDYDNKKCTNGYQPKPKRYGFKLDLPQIHFSSRTAHLSFYRKPDYSSKIFREFKDIKKMGIPVDHSPGDSRSVISYVSRFDALDNMQRNLKDKLGLYLMKKKVSFTVDGQSFWLNRSITDIRKTKTQKQPPLHDSETVIWQEFVQPCNWLSSLDLAQHSTHLRKAWNTPSKPFTRMDVSKVAQLLGISAKRICSLSLIVSTKIDVFQELSFHSVIPDLLKMLALTAWQKGDSSKSFFYLTESQNFFIRREVLEKHSSYFLRKSYDKYRDKSHVPSESDEKREELFRVQSENLQTFGNTSRIFEKNLMNVNPDWNVIQLTKLFHHKNRFGASQNGGSQAFAIFISALISINDVRLPFTIYQSPPKIEAGLSNQGVIERFRVLMMKNRKLNEQYRGTRQRYWQQRSQHNLELKSLLDTVEENWLYPWEFLLPGNVMDTSIISHIQKFLVDAEETMKAHWAPSVKGVLYKLVENYNLLKPELQTNLPNLIQWLTEASERVSRDVAALVIQYGSGLHVQSYKRSPTILVLDQELDLIPWESMDCLKSTPVTRVPSVSLMTSLMLLRNLKKLKYSEPIDPKSCGYVLNPDGTLKGVEERLSNYFNGVVSWTGVTGHKPDPSDLESYFQSKDVYLYCGHGSGSTYFSEHRIQKVTCRAVPLLMGCGSVRYKHYGPRSLSNSIVTSLFSATSVCSVGFLYEVTDLECDRVTLELLEHWAPGAKSKLPEILSFDPNAKRHRVRCLATAVRFARGGATQFVTSAGLVCYGIPVLTNDI